MHVLIGPGIAQEDNLVLGLVVWQKQDVWDKKVF